MLCVLLVCALACAAEQKVDRVLVLKKKHTMYLLHQGTVVKTYAIALGLGGLKPKRRDGDERTPEGLYTIDGRNPNSDYHRALHISYPNRVDRARARRRGVRPGGDIMIHGLPNDVPDGVAPAVHDWTAGCIAVTNRDIEEIYGLVSDGTAVEIRP